MDGWCCLYISLQGLCFTPIGMRNQCRTVSRHLTLSDFSSNRSVWFLWEWRVKSGNRGIIQKEQTMAGTWMVALVRSDSGCILTGEPVRFNNASDVNVRERACIGLLCCAQSCLTLRNPMDCSAPGSSVHGILQARILEWVAMPFSRGSSDPRIEPVSLETPALQADSLPTELSGKFVRATVKKEKETKHRNNTT